MADMADKNKICSILLISVGTIVIYLSFISVHAQTFPKFTIMTENWKPYNFSEDGKTQGVAVDLLLLMLEKVGSKQIRKDIKILPWSRAYGLLTHKPNTMLFSMTRNSKRENLFKWVGPIDENLIEIIARKDRNVTINTIADIHKYKIGTILDNAGEQLIVAQGVPLHKMQRVVGRTQVQHLLHIGRIDVTAGNLQGFMDSCRAAGYNPDNYESVFVLNRNSIFYAFHKDTPNSVIVQLQEAFDEIKTDGSYTKIRKKYKFK
jgi:polar amino acid transport system substrate-binding protein